MIPLTPDVDGVHVYTFESSQLEGSCVGDLLHLAFVGCPERWVRSWSMHILLQHFDEKTA